MENVVVDEETIVRPKNKEKSKKQPLYNVILLNDDHHTVDYVVGLCKKLFGYEIPKGLQIANNVHNGGRAIIWTGTLELAELKQEQIHNYGADPYVKECKGEYVSDN